MNINREYREMLYVYAANERLLSMRSGVSQKRKRVLRRNNKLIRINFDKVYGLGNFDECYSDIKNNLVKRDLDYVISIRDKQSSGEVLVANKLDELSVNYMQEVSFTDLPFLTFDFFLPYNNAVIEVDGRQHFEYVEDFHDSEKDLVKQKKNDNLKRSFAYKNNLIYVRFKYSELDNIENKLRVKGVIP
jgi:very-short-patch-repair endonuclease